MIRSNRCALIKEFFVVFSSSTYRRNVHYRFTIDGRSKVRYYVRIDRIQTGGRYHLVQKQQTVHQTAQGKRTVKLYNCYAALVLYLELKVLKGSTYSPLRSCHTRYETT